MVLSTLHNTLPAGSMRRRAARGFTIIELVVAILVIALLAGLIIVGIRAAQGGASQAIAISATEGVKKGVESFKTEMGFLPPLLKDRRGLDTQFSQAQLETALQQLVVASGGRNALVAYERVADGEFLRGFATNPDYLGPNPAAGPQHNQFRDNRYSELTLGVYLAGALDEPFGTAAPLSEVVIDGIPGPGMYKPTREGTFEVPKQALDATAANRKQVGKTYASFLQLSGSLKLLVDRADGATPERNRRVLIADRNNVPLRYYRWLNGRRYTAGGDYEVRGVNDVRVPPLVGRFESPPPALVPDAVQPPPAADPLIHPAFANGTNPLQLPLRDREPERCIGLDGTVGNQALKTATYAIVAAGNNKVFGDEAIGAIAGALGVPIPVDPSQVQTLREQAASDNIVKVGDDVQ